MIGDELAERELNGQLFEAFLLIERQRVVHVEADDLDRRHLEISIAEDPPFARHLDVALDVAEKRRHFPVNILPVGSHSAPVYTRGEERRNFRRRIF